jgi:hypothetical protein
MFVASYHSVIVMYQISFTESGRHYSYMLGNYP